MFTRQNRKFKNLSGRFGIDGLPVLLLMLFAASAASAQGLLIDDFTPGAYSTQEAMTDTDNQEVTIIHAWGITNPAPALYGTNIAPPGRTHCTWDAPKSCWELTNDEFLSPSAPGVCWTNTAPYGPYADDCDTGASPCHDSSGDFLGMWHGWIRNWWLEGWLPSIGVSPEAVRKAYVIYNRNYWTGGPGHYADCEATLQLQQAIVDAYTNCDTRVIVTTHSNGGVTFLWAWRDFIEAALNGPMGSAYDSQRRTACIDKERTLPETGDTPPLFVNGHLMQAAVGNGDFFPIHPYATVGRRYWEPTDTSGNKRALLGVRFYYNHEDVMTYDYAGISPVGRNAVLRWLDGTSDGAYVGASFWLSRQGLPPYAALHACGHTSAHSRSMGADNSICGDLIIRVIGGIGSRPWQACSTNCSANLSKWYESAQGPAFCLNPCHRNCWGPTALTAISIREPAVYPDKFPFSFGNPNLPAMGSDLRLRGWFENASRLDWTQLYDRQVDWCYQESRNMPQEPHQNGRWPKYGPLIPGRNDGSGEVEFP